VDNGNSDRKVRHKKMGRESLVHGAFLVVWLVLWIMALYIICGDFGRFLGCLSPLK